MLTDQYKDTVYIMGRRVTLAEIDVSVRSLTLMICVINLVLNIIRLARRK
jgi:hypothetical protein